jgi:hypothetical protein
MFGFINSLFNNEKLQSLQLNSSPRLKPTTANITTITLSTMKVKKEPTRCRKVEVFIGVINSTCFGHRYAHHQEYKKKPMSRIRCSAVMGIMMTETC